MRDLDQSIPPQWSRRNPVDVLGDAKSKLVAKAAQIILQDHGVDALDEPLWLALLASCSRESIYSRFRYFFFWQSHEVASRYCYIDHDRELAIVAEVGDGPDRRFVGVGRLAAEPGRTSAEHAVLVQDAWQDKGLGGLVTDHCLGIAKEWGVRTVTAITTTDNSKMIAVFEKRGFHIVNDLESSLVEASKELL